MTRLQNFCSNHIDLFPHISTASIFLSTRTTYCVYIVFAALFPQHFFILHLYSISSTIFYVAVSYDTEHPILTNGAS